MSRGGLRLAVPSIARLRASLHSPIFRNSFFLLVRSAVTYAMGFVFWLVVARSYAPPDVGIAAAVLSTLLLLARAAALGLPTGILRFLPAGRGKGDLINGALTLSAISSLALGLAFLGGLDLWAAPLAFLRADLILAVVVLLSLVFFTLDGVVDNAFVAARRADLGLVRIAVFYGLRIPLAVAFAGIGLLGILGSWVLSLVLSVAGAAALLPRLYPDFRPAPSLRQLREREMMGFSLWSYASGLVAGASNFLMPLIILNTLGAADGADASAHFYAAFTIATFLYAVPTAFSTSLLVEGSHPDTEYPADVRRTILYSSPLLALGIAGTVLLGPWLLGLFGASYAAEGYVPLLILAAASPLLLATSVYSTHLRVAKRVKPIFGISTVAIVSQIVAAYILLPRIGIPGAALAVVASQSVTLALFAVERVLHGAPAPAAA